VGPSQRSQPQQGRPQREGVGGHRCKAGPGGGACASRGRATRRSGRFPAQTGKFVPCHREPWMAFLHVASEKRTWRGRLRLTLCLVMLLAMAGGFAVAQTPQSEAPATQLPPVEVVSTSPLLGSGVDRNTVPAETHVLNSDDLKRGAWIPRREISSSRHSSITASLRQGCRERRRVSRSMSMGCASTSRLATRWIGI
jgi:hypothetical protein